MTIKKQKKAWFLQCMFEFDLFSELFSDIFSDLFSDPFSDLCSDLFLDPFSDPFSDPFWPPKEILFGHGVALINFFRPKYDYK